MRLSINTFENRIRKRNLKTRPGVDSILSFLIAVTVLAPIISFTTLSYTFEVSQRTFAKIADTALTQILINGQMTADIEKELRDTMRLNNFDPDKVTIISNIPGVVDADPNTAALWGETIEVTMIYNAQHDLGKFLSYVTGANTNTGKIAFKGYGISEYSPMPEGPGTVS